MCFNSFCGCRRNRCHRFNEESSSSSSSDHNNNRNKNRNTFRVESFFDQDDFCRAVRRCNQRNRNRNRRNDNWDY